MTHYYTIKFKLVAKIKAHDLNEAILAAESALFTQSFPDFQPEEFEFVDILDTDDEDEL